jgi:spore germination protein KC
MPKNILIITIIIGLLASVNNYSSSGENIDDLAYVMAVGIDVGTTAKYKISLQLSTIESSATEAIIKPEENEEDSSGGGKGASGSSSSSGGQNSSNSFEIYTMECDSLDTAINITNTFLNKDITLSHCKVLVISEEQAKEDIARIINTFINKVEIRPDCNIIISSIPKDEFSGSNVPKLENLLSKYYDITANNETRNRIQSNSRTNKLSPSTGRFSYGTIFQPWKSWQSIKKCHTC